MFGVLWALTALHKLWDNFFVSFYYALTALHWKRGRIQLSHFVLRNRILYSDRRGSRNDVLRVFSLGSMQTPRTTANKCFRPRTILSQNNNATRQPIFEHVTFRLSKVWQGGSSVLYHKNTRKKQSKAIRPWRVRQNSRNIVRAVLISSFIY